MLYSASQSFVWDDERICECRALEDVVVGDESDMLAKPLQKMLTPNQVGLFGLISLSLWGVQRRKAFTAGP